MSKQKLFDEDSEEEVAIKTENAYAKKYDTWREKEEIHKLEQKYGAKALNSGASTSSDSEDEDDEPLEVSEEVEEQFLKTLALLKTKDPRIYDPSYKFFEEKQKEKVKEEKKKTITFADSDEDDSEDGNIFRIEKKAEIAEENKAPVKDVSSLSTVGKDVKLKDYLTGKLEHLGDPVENDLAPLKALWSDPKLDEGEAFLRDYILNRRYLEEGDAGDAEDKIRDDDDLETDAKMVEEQGRFERAYNFRFEEPDQEYLKRFPRTVNSTRPKDDKRSRKRAEVRDRKEEEKRRKMEEIGRLKALKLKEIREKIAKIKEVTGNEELAFKDEDIEGDFDPEEHDKRMKAIFDEEFYGDVDDQKPVFPDLDEELEIENWDNYEPTADEETGAAHCEDADFNMDADYDPKQARANLLQEIQSTLGKKRRNRKKKSKLAKVLATDKPTFLPAEDKTYDQYMEEYYKIDCEDVVGELPTRFKYKEVVPNDYGLTVEEILLADDKELTQWVPLKRLVRLRPESVQKSEVAAYRQKAADVALKRKVLPSLFKDLPEEPELIIPKGTKKKKNKNKRAEETVDNSEENEPSEQNGEEIKEPKDKSKKKGKNQEIEGGNTADNGFSILSNEPVDNSARRKKKNKNKYVQETDSIEESINEDLETSTTADGDVNLKNDDVIKRKKKKKNKNKKTEDTLDNTEENEPSKLNSNEEKDAKGKNKKKERNRDVDNESTAGNGLVVLVNETVDTSTKRKKKKKNKYVQETESIEVSNDQDMETSTTADREVNLGNDGELIKRKKKSLFGFEVQNTVSVMPSQENVAPTQLKRKHGDNMQDSHIPNKKKKNKNKPNSTNNVQGKKNKEFKKNFNTKEKFKNRQNTDNSSDNPLNKLSDERLKAYGLNPKKYRSFLKYKKF